MKNFHLIYINAVNVNDASGTQTCPEEGQDLSCGLQSDEGLWLNNGIHPLATAYSISNGTVSLPLSPSPLPFIHKHHCCLPVFPRWPQWEGNGWAWLWSPDSLWLWCLYQPPADRPLLLNNRSILHETTVFHSYTFTLWLLLYVTCSLCDFEWLSAYCADLFVKQTSIILEISELWLCGPCGFLIYFFVCLCLFLSVSQQTQHTPGQDSSINQSGSSTEPFLWPWGGRHHSRSQGACRTHSQEGLLFLNQSAVLA